MDESYGPVAGKSGPGRRMIAMKRMLLLPMAMFLVGLFVGSVALAQGTTVMQDTTMIVVDLAPSGGPSILLPAAALLLGTGVLKYAILRRRG